MKVFISHSLGRYINKFTAFKAIVTMEKIPPLEDLIDLNHPFLCSEKKGFVRISQGPSHELRSLEEIHSLAKSERCDIAFVLPYHCIREKGFEAQGDEPILAIAIERHFEFKSTDFLATLPQCPLNLEQDITSSLSDDEYAQLVKNFQSQEIETGNASQTTLSRRFEGKISNFDIQKALTIFKMLAGKTGHYMAVLYANIDPDSPENSQFIVGATPERHLTICGDETLMIPIAGTLRKEDKKTFPKRLEKFVSDPKEINELFQVVDEEMKIMGRICPQGGKVEGPFLREIGAVIHSEYRLVGKRSKDTISALRQTLHAPTVVGSPMESAARIIAKYEPCSRRYYGGEIGYYKEPRTDLPNGDLDTAILLRCAEISNDGNFIVQAGGGLVRDSDPHNEARESTAKARGFIDILTASSTDQEKFLTDKLQSKIKDQLSNRNKTLSPFWLMRQESNTTSMPLNELSVSIVNNEDDFAFMLAHIIKSYGADVKVIDTFSFNAARAEDDIVILGPGPGDPNDVKHPRMKQLHNIANKLLESKTPVLGVCLGHQILSIHQGIRVERQTRSTQGMQKRVRSFNKDCYLGFYNSFSPVLAKENALKPDVRVDIDEQNRIIAMQGNGFIGFQYHPESIMSENGNELLYKALVSLWYAL